MKINPSARRIVKIRVMLLGLVIVAIAVLEFRLGESMAPRIGQTTATGTEVPSVDISYLMVVAH